MTAVLPVISPPRDVRPRWTVSLDARSGPTATYRLEDAARRDVDWVSIRVAGCELLSCPDGVLTLREHEGVFVVSLADRSAALAPTVTIAWLMRRTGFTASWSTLLADPGPWPVRT